MTQRSGTKTQGKSGSRTRETRARLGGGGTGSGFLLGIVMLAVAVLGAGMLAYQHFGAHIPGCGPESACASLEKTIWGKVPGIGWPVSFLGVAYFAALLAAWIAVRGMLDPKLRLIVNMGAIVSALFVGLMVSLGKVCFYCLVSHLANFAFVGIAMRRESRLGALRPALASSAAVFAVVTIVLAMAESSHQRGLAARAEQERTESRDAILAQSRESTPESAESAPLVAEEPDPPAPERAETLETSERSEAAPAPTPSPQSQAPAASSGFTGRYRVGPEKAPIRIVTLTDYQCPDCRRIEKELEAILAQRRDVSFSTKHFPMCKDAAPGVPCNRYATMSLHPNACNAARAAEAAGILGGDGKFWEMHRWLFDREGKFDNAQLTAQVQSLGLDPVAFRTVMTGPETLQRVHADVEEGFTLGLHYTPMVFVNGVEFRGWQTPGSLARTVEEVAATNPPARTAEADRPPPAERKIVDDWLAQPVLRIAPSAMPHWIGGAAGSPPAEIILFGDYEEPNTANVDAVIRAFVARNPTSRYTFRHFPIFSECNPTLPPNVRKEAIHPNACAMARAAEAAGKIGGQDAFWRMHAWLMENQARFSVAALDAAAREMGIDPEQLRTEMQAAEVTATIAADTRAAQVLRLTAVPWVFVDNRWVPRTSRAGKVVIGSILEEAMKR